ncbi:MAG: ABC transporter permease subunit [Deltaproteobacteria bacterium]|nr:ABC transporter permease subunit [Deltaproteobacteria bacterium]
MGEYFLRRILAMLPTFLGITLVTFVVINLAPGGPLERMMADIRFGAAMAPGSSGPGGLTHEGVTEEILEELKRQFGYDKPLLTRYVLWLGNILRLDFGKSFVHDEPVVDVILSKIPVSVQFGVTSLALTYLFCIPLGVFKAVRDGSAADTATSALVYAGYAVSPLMLGILLIVLFGGGTFLDWFPVTGSASDFHDMMTPGEKVLDRLHHSVLPLACYLIGNFATLTLLMKNAFMEELGKPYVTTARAKGLPESRVRYGHVLRNALIPIVTGLGGLLGVFFVGNLFIEQIFALDGMGLLFYDSLLARDYPVLLGILTLVSLALMLGNLLSDFLYVLVDPRIDFSR